MSVYDSAGNMANNDVAVFSHNVSEQVRKLFEVLFATRELTVVEARALLHYFQSEIDTVVSMCIMQHQMAGTLGPVPVKVYSNCPICLDKTCPYKKECANHNNAGDYRFEDGSTPDLTAVSKQTGGESLWYCSQRPEQTGGGAALVDGQHANDWKTL